MKQKKYVVKHAFVYTICSKIELFSVFFLI